MPRQTLIIAFCLLAPLASALYIQFVDNRNNSSPEERQPAKKECRHPYWTHQRLRDHLDGKYLWDYTGCLTEF